MASSAQPTLSEDEVKQIIDKYRELSINFFDGASVVFYKAFARLLQLRHLNKDLELEGMQIKTTSDKFGLCVQQIGEKGIIGCAFSSSYFNIMRTYSDRRLMEIHEGSDSIRVIKREYIEQKEKANLTLKEFGECLDLVAEVYVRYNLTTRGTSDQTTETLATMRQEIKSVMTTWAYLNSLFTSTNEQIADDSSDIPEHYTTKFLIYENFIRLLPYYETFQGCVFDIINTTVH